jgi:hypothetical protein
MSDGIFNNSLLSTVSGSGGSGTVNLPAQFHYELPVLRKRQSFHQTVGGVRWLYATDNFYMDTEIPWECNDCTVTQLNDIRGSSLIEFGTTYAFNGCWGENLTVLTLSFDNPVPKPGRLFDLSGSLLVYTASDFEGVINCDGTVT